MAGRSNTNGSGSKEKAYAKKKKSGRIGEGRFAFLYEELLTSLAYKALNLSAKVLLNYCLLEYTKANYGDKASAENKPWSLPWSPDLPMSESTYTAARRQLEGHGFIEVHQEVQSSLPGKATKYLSVDAWRTWKPAVDEDATTKAQARQRAAIERKAKRELSQAKARERQERARDRLADFKSSGPKRSADLPDHIPPRPDSVPTPEPASDTVATPPLKPLPPPPRKPPSVPPSEYLQEEDVLTKLLKAQSARCARKQAENAARQRNGQSANGGREYEFDVFLAAGIDEVTLEDLN